MAGEDRGIIRILSHKYDICLRLFSGGGVRVEVRLRLFKRITAAVLALMLILLYSPVRAVLGETGNQKLTLTFDECANKAAGSSIQLSKLYTGISSMRDGRDSLQAAEGQAWTALNTYMVLSVKELDDKKTVSDLDAGFKAGTLTPTELLVYQAAMTELATIGQLRIGLLALGMNPSNLSLEEQYIHIVKPLKFQWMELDTSIDNTSMNGAAISNTIKNGVRTIYDNIQSLEDSIKIQDESLILQQKKYDTAKLKFDNGQISELDRYSSEVDLKKAALTRDTSVRNKDNLYLLLKRQMGTNLKQDLELKPYDSTPSDLKLLGSGEYLNKALSNRYEILSAENNLDLKQSEFSIMEDYISYTSSPYYEEAQDSVQECSFALRDAINNVTRDIKLGYADALKKQRAVNSASQKVDSALRRLDEYKLRYQLGAINDTVLKDTEISYEQAQAGYKKAVMDFNTALYKLNMASGIGPSYFSGGIN